MRFPTRLRSTRQAFPSVAPRVSPQHHGLDSEPTIPKPWNAALVEPRPTLRWCVLGSSTAPLANAWPPDRLHPVRLPCSAEAAVDRYLGAIARLVEACRPPQREYGMFVRICPFNYARMYSNIVSDHHPSDVC